MGAEVIALLLVTLAWTVPTLSVSGHPYVPREARVYAHRQSAAWRALRPAMLADGDVWAAYWPIVAAEARAFRVATIPLGWQDCGRAMTWSAPDTSETTYWYVTTVDSSGRESANSNEVGK